MKGNLLLIIFSLLCVTSVSSAVNIIYVDVDGPNEPRGGPSPTDIPPPGNS